jgi:hypothetical protein
MAVPPEAGDAKSAPARRQALRLSDAENVATTRLDMFGDPALKDALASTVPGPGEAPPPGPREAHGAPLQPMDGGPDSARLEIPDEPLAEAPAPALLPPHHADPGLDAEVRPHPFAVSGHPAAAMPPPEPHDGSQNAGEDVPPAGEASALEAANAGDAGSAPPPDASDAAGAPPEATTEEVPGAKGPEGGPFGSFFMMPPGSSEQAGMEGTPGPMLAPPRFRDELMFVRDTDGNPITADSTILAEPEATPPAEVPPASELPPAFELSPASEPAPEPPYMEPYAALPEEPPAAPSFPVFSVASPYPEPHTGFEEEDPYLRPEPPPEAPPHVDAAARIAAEADATAAALENLERLLEQKRPSLHMAAPAYRPDPFLEPAAPTAAQANSLGLRTHRMEPDPRSFPRPPERAPLMPLPMPPPRSRRNVYLIGFLTGLALSLMAGAVLYFFIMHTGAG